MVILYQQIKPHSGWEKEAFNLLLQAQPHAKHTLIITVISRAVRYLSPVAVSNLFGAIFINMQMQ